MSELDPSNIMKIGLAFWPSKVLLTAVELELFTVLDDKELTGEQIRVQLDLHKRSLYDFLDTLVSLQFLHRKGLYEKAVYSNTPETKVFLNKNAKEYVGGILEMANGRLFHSWNSLGECLKTGLPFKDNSDQSENEFENLYASPERLKQFVHAMSGIQMGNFIKFAKEFDFSNHKTLCDIGGSAGMLSAQVLLNNENMKATSADLPQIQTIANETIDMFSLNGRMETCILDFFKEDFPKADVITMGNILHDWDLETKLMLIGKAYDALPEGGSFVVLENIIDNERNKDPFGLLMSLNMLVETNGGFDYTFDKFTEWTTEKGFKETKLMHLEGPSFAAIAIK